MSENQYTTWCNHDIFTIKMVGTCEFIKERLETLVEDFLEPKFGYRGELFDEYHDDDEFE